MAEDGGIVLNLTNDKVAPSKKKQSYAQRAKANQDRKKQVSRFLKLKPKTKETPSTNAVEVTVKNLAATSKGITVKVPSLKAALTVVTDVPHKLRVNQNDRNSKRHVAAKMSQTVRPSNSFDFAPKNAGAPQIQMEKKILDHPFPMNQAVSPVEVERTSYEAIPMNKAIPRSQFEGRRKQQDRIPMNKVTPHSQFESRPRDDNPFPLNTSTATNPRHSNSHPIPMNTLSKVPAPTKRPFIQPLSKSMQPREEYIPPKQRSTHMPMEAKFSEFASNVKLGKVEDAAQQKPAERVPLSGKYKKAVNTVKRKIPTDVVEDTEVAAKRPHIVAAPKNSMFETDVDADQQPSCAPVETVHETLFSSKEFSSLDIHKHLVANLASRLKITKMTLVQSRAIPKALQGRDILVKAQTGSGKTLAYSVPLVQHLCAMTPPITRNSGTYALVIVPTRELALQTYNVISSLCHSFVNIVPGYLIGGEKKKAEKARIRKGINILVTTPGRLADHIDSTENLDVSQLKHLVIDEADRLSDCGFEKQVQHLITKIREKVGDIIQLQTNLVSATLTPPVEKLAGLTLRDAVFIDVADASPTTTGSFAVPENLEQFYLVCPAKTRLVVLACFLLGKLAYDKKRVKKIIVFAASQDIVDYLFNLFSAVLTVMNDSDVEEASGNAGTRLKFYRLHGNMNQTERNGIFNLFNSDATGCLFSTDVSARGLDLPLLDWVVQFSVPESPEVYIHRVGRTARAGAAGKALLVLLPSETSYLSLLSDYSMNLTQLSLSDVTANAVRHLQMDGNQRRGLSIENACVELQHNFEDLVAEDEEMKAFAMKAYMSFVRSYATYKSTMKLQFNIKTLHLGHIARSFALRAAPNRISEILYQQMPTVPKRPYEKVWVRGSGHGRTERVQHYRVAPLATLVAAGSGLPFAGEAAPFTAPDRRHSLGGSDASRRSQSKLAHKNKLRDTKVARRVAPISKRFSEFASS